MLDATKSEEQKHLLELELDAVGIRLNKTKPDVVFKKKTTGGVRLIHFCFHLAIMFLPWSRLHSTPR
jgi:ribosome-interacting GTPase 1